MSLPVSSLVKYITFIDKLCEQGTSSEAPQSKQSSEQNVTYCSTGNPASAATEVLHWRHKRSSQTHVFQVLSEYGFAYSLKTGTCPFSTNVSCEPHGEGKETSLCPSTDRLRFRLFPSTVWAGREYGLDWFQVRFRYPLR